MKRLLLVLVLAAVAAADDLAPRLRAALVNIETTSQSWDQANPWRKRDVTTETGSGFVVEPGVILTLASAVEDPRMIQVSVANSARLYPARLKHVDPRLDLALLEILDEELRARMQPLAVGEPIGLDDTVDLYQLGRDNLLERYTARVVSATAEPTMLNLTVDTTLGGEGDGQVAIRDGKVVGMLTHKGKGQEGTILGVETIRHYLDDFKDGVYNGCPGPGLWVQPLLRADLRAYYGLKPDQHGLAITRVMQGRTGDGVLKEGDVLLEVDGYDLDDEGKFNHEVHGRLSAGYLFQGRRYAGDTMKVKVLRDGQVKDLTIELRPFPAAEQRVPDRPAGGRPQYLMVGGLVILELTQDFSVYRSTGGVVLRRYKDRATWDPPSERKRIVFVDHVLEDPSNKGMEEIRHAVLESVNGQPIHDIADVAKALEQPQGKFQVFHFEGVESDFVIPVAELAQINDRIAKTYKVTRLRYLTGDPE